MKSHVHKSCEEAAASVARHRVPDDAIFCCGLLHLIPVFVFAPTRFSFKVPPGSAVACTASIVLKSFIILIVDFMHPRKLRAWRR